MRTEPPGYLWPSLALIWLLVCMPIFALTASHSVLGYWGLVLWLASVPFVATAMVMGCWTTLRLLRQARGMAWALWLLAGPLWALIAAAGIAVVIERLLAP